MSTFQIRILAICSMVIDHVGLFFFPQYQIFRIIGRLAFPLFAWLIANGAHHTKNGILYLKRLFILACIAQVPFALANHKIGNPYWFFNVVFTLCLGLAIILAIQRTTDWRWRTIVSILALVVAYGCNTDYGIVGVASIVFFYLFFKAPWKMVLSQSIVFGAPILWFVLVHAYHHQLTSITIYTFNELVGMVSLIPIYLYTNKEGAKAKYLFYLFYPLQYVVIYLLQLKFYAN